MPNWHLKIHAPDKKEPAAKRAAGIPHKMKVRM